MEQEDCGGNFRSFEGQQVSGAFISARTIFTGGVVPELVGGGFGEEIGFGRQDLSLEQFGFDGVVNAFDVGVGVGAGRGIEAVLGMMFLFDGPVKAADLIVGGVAVVFGAEVGGDDDLGGIEAVVFEMGEEAIRGQGGVSFGEFVAVGQELGAARDAVPTKEDLIPYLRGIPDVDADGSIKPVAGERYRLKTLAESPEAELTREIEGSRMGQCFDWEPMGRRK